MWKCSPGFRNSGMSVRGHKHARARTHTRRTFISCLFTVELPLTCELCELRRLLHAQLHWCPPCDSWPPVAAPREEVSADTKYWMSSISPAEHGHGAVLKAAGWRERKTETKDARCRFIWERWAVNGAEYPHTHTHTQVGRECVYLEKENVFYFY